MRPLDLRLGVRIPKVPLVPWVFVSPSSGSGNQTLADFTEIDAEEGTGCGG